MACKISSSLVSILWNSYPECSSSIENSFSQMIPNAEWYCEGATLMNATNGITLGAAQEECNKIGDCNFVSMHASRDPVPSFAWLCRGDDWIQRIQYRHSKENQAAVAVNPKKREIRDTT